MHRLPSDSIKRKFRIAAFLVLLRWVSIPVAIGYLAYGLSTREHWWLVGAAIAGGMAVIFGAVNLAMGGKIKCPLCMMPPLLGRRCSRHRTAKTAFGSHHLLVALHVLAKGSFRCPYCGEPTAMKAREKR